MANDTEYTHKKNSIDAFTVDEDWKMYWLPLLVETCQRRFDDDFHCHDFVQIWYVLEGELIHNIGDTSYHMKAGSCSVVLPYTKHYLDMCLSDTPPKLLSLSFTDSFLLDRGYRFFSYAKNFARFEECTVPPFCELEDDARSIADELSDKMLSEFGRYKHMNFDVLAAYLAEFLRLFCTYNTQSKGFVSMRENANAITNSIRYMKSNMSKKITLDDLCAVACMSRSVYTRSFRAVTGKSSATFLLGLRIAYAKQILALSDMKVDEIARRVGLNDKTRLAHVFSEHVGLTPSQYRASMRISAAKEHHAYLERWAWFNPDDFTWHDLAAK